MKKRKSEEYVFRFIHRYRSVVKSYVSKDFSSLFISFLSFQRALEILETNAKYKDDDVNKSRALAFRRGSAVLKSLPFTVTSLEQVRGLADIGKHCLSVIQVYSILGITPYNSGTLL